ncbi:MAG: outer membrane beta-barrel protein [Chitinophagaceae bacterium]
MKHVKTLLIAVATLIASNAMAQPEAGDININAGVGAGLSFATSGKISLPPVGLSVDYNLNERISIGGLVNYSSSNWDYGFGKYKLTYTVIGARVNYHFASSETLDPYAGVLLAYNLFNSKWEGTGTDPSYNFGISAFIPGVYVGARYKFSETIGIFGEAGYATPYLRAGLNLKF